MGNAPEHRYNLADQLTEIEEYDLRNGTWQTLDTFTYDDSGQQLTGNGLTLAYNDRGQTTSATPAGVSAQSYGYANNGQTNRLDINGTAVTPSLRGVQSLDGGYSPIETLRDPSGGLLAIRQRSAGTWNYVIADHLGSVRALATAAGTTTAEYDYDPWGNTLTSSGSFAGQNPYRYVGTLGYHTDNTGLIQVGARYYHPDIQRWTQPDPSALETNAYNYASNSPINNSDPSGLVSAECAALAVGGVAIAGLAITLTGGLAAGVAAGTVSSTAATVAGSTYTVASTAAATSVAATSYTSGCSAVLPP